MIYKQISNESGFFNRSAAVNCAEWKDYCAPLLLGLKEVIMETDFSTTILCTDGQKREFHFARINSVAIYFHISVVDNSGRLITATLARDQNGRWKLHDQELPGWFITAEPELGNQVEYKART